MRNLIKTYTDRHRFNSLQTHKAEKMKLCTALILLLLVASCQAKTLIVDPGESGDAKTLLAAISLAGIGDTIQILPGNYAGANVDKSR